MKLAPDLTVGPAVGEPVANANGSGEERFYAPALDGLRFFAFFTVFIHHLFSELKRWPLFEHPVMAWLGVFGWAGVDLFLCLSGFLITRLLILEWQKAGHLRIGAFYLRRALRIWPLYFAVVVFAFLVLPVYAPHGLEVSPARHEAMVSAHGWSFPLFLANWTIGLKGYTPTVLLSPLWTVSLEEQFYLFWPWVMLLCLKRGFRIPYACLIMLAFTVVARLVLVKLGCKSIFVWTNTFTRLDPLALGALLGTNEVYGWMRKRGVLESLMALAASLVAFALVRQGGNIRAQTAALGWQFALTAFASTLMVFACMAKGPFAWFLSRGFLRYSGKISYGLYVFHFAALRMVDRGVHKNVVALAPGLVALGALCATYALSVLSYELYERWFLRFKERWAVVRSRPA
jgi:peptidoglycan/LPS O-acetylase OafA/YrhL